MLTNSRHVSLLTGLYVENDYPSDRLRARRAHLDCFADEFNSRAKASYDAEEIGDTLICLRKQGRLPRLGRRWSGPRFSAEPNN